MKELIGKKIVAAYLSSDKTYLGFEIEGGERLLYFTDGDCCSYSWIEYVNNSEYLAGSRVVDVQDIDVPGIGDRSDDECIQCYGVKVVLEGRPAFELEYRNSSNGYYGGSIERAKFCDDVWRKLLEISEYERLMTCQGVQES